MSRQAFARGTAAVAVAMTLTACASEIGGLATVPTTEDAAESRASKAPGTGSAVPSTPTTRSVPNSPGSVAGPGECVSGDSSTPVDCAQPHTVEITSAGTFDSSFGGKRPDRNTVFEAVFPTCRAEATQYLGSAEYDVTTLAAWLLWAGPDAWKRGERWYRCGVVQLDAEGNASSRTGSVRNVLTGTGLHEFRLCSTTPPARKLPKPVPCDEPHRGEAVTVVPMGTPGDPLPTGEEFTRAAKKECPGAVRDYLGADRNDVFASWRWPDRTAWRRGFNNFTCYVETEVPVTAPLRDLGTKPLPTG